MSVLAPILNSTNVSELLKCSVRTVEDYARSGRLPSLKIGDGWIFPTDALIQAVNRMAIEESEKRAQPCKPIAVGYKGCSDLPDLSKLLNVA
jgi:excisionase family DNA binding protein